MSDNKAKNCCDNPEFVSDTKIVVFEVDNAAHKTNKMIHFNLKWCAQCEEIKTLDCTQISK